MTAPAWLAWLGLHLMTLMGMRNRVSVLVNWSWNYLTWDRGPRLIFGGAPTGSTLPEANPADPGGPMPDSEAIRSLVDRYVETFSTADRVAWLDLWAEEATMEDPVGSPLLTTRDERGAFFDESHAMVERLRLVRTGPVRVSGAEAAFPMQARPVLGGEEFCVDIIDVMSFTEAEGQARIATMRAFWDPTALRPAED